jgi:hypothetical protein
MTIILLIRKLFAVFLLLMAFYFVVKNPILKTDDVDKSTTLVEITNYNFLIVVLITTGMLFLLL